MKTELQQARAAVAAGEAGGEGARFAAVSEGLAGLEAALGTGHEEEYGAELSVVLARIVALHASPARTAALRWAASSLVEPDAKARPLLAAAQAHAAAALHTARADARQAGAALAKAEKQATALAGAAGGLRAAGGLEERIRLKAEREVEALRAGAEAAGARREARAGRALAGAGALAEAVEQVLVAARSRCEAAASPPPPPSAPPRTARPLAVPPPSSPRAQPAAAVEHGSAGQKRAAATETAAAGAGPGSVAGAVDRELGVGGWGQAEGGPQGKAAARQRLALRGVSETVAGVEAGAYPALHPRANETLSDRPAPPRPAPPRPAPPCACSRLRWLTARAVRQIAAYEAAVAEAGAEAAQGGALPRHPTYINVWPARPAPAPPPATSGSTER